MTKLNSDKLKIFFPAELFHPSQAGGMANGNYWVAKHLRPNGFDPVVIATDKGLGSDIDLGRWVDSKAGRIKYIRTPRVHYPFRQSLACVKQVMRADIIHVTSVFYPAAFFSATLAKLTGKKLVLSPQGELDPPALSHSAARKRPVLGWLKRVLNTYPSFHATCEAEKEYIKNTFGRDARVTIIPNYIELPEQIHTDQQDYLLFIGRLHPKKGIDRLIEALPLSRRFMESGYLLKIAGSGWGLDETALRKLASDLGLSGRVEFVGQVEGQVKERLLAEARWTIMPSHTENFGIVVPESLAQGTPVLASRGTPWQILEEERVGFWTDNDSPSLARQIDQMLEMPNDVYAGYRNRARPFVERKFDIEKNIGDWIDFYRSL